MLRKVLLTVALLALFAPAVSLAGGFVEEEQPQMIQEPLVAHSTANHDGGEGMSPEVLAALIAGGLGLTGVVITAVVSINSRRKSTSGKAASRSKKKKR
jgi:hypothetical protein